VMVTFPLGAGAAQVALVSDAQYPIVVGTMVAEARTRCLVSMFIVDLVNAENAELVDLIDTLAEAKWRGVDTRVVVGGSRENYPIAITAATARAVLSQAGVPTRWLTAAPTIGSHAKFVVADDMSLLGSHNWSPGSFSGRQVQDSVVIDSSGLAGMLHIKFERQWLRAGVS
jgi:phosphatidylserine/phosphatidylglycerophosphate/cardiolipin synthase-like enzyme